MKKSDKPIAEHIKDFLEYIDVEKGLGIRSQQTYQRFLEKFIRWLSSNDLSELKPHELTPDHIYKYRVFLASSINQKTRQPLKKSSQGYYLIALRNLLKYFSDKDIEAISADKIKLPRSRSQEKAVKFLDLEQITRLLEEPDPSTKTGLRDKALLETLFSTGLRVAELANLNREQIKIPKEKASEGLEIVVIGKGNRPRPVYFSIRALSWLGRYLDTRDDMEKALFIGYKGPKSRAKRLSTRSIESIVKKYAVLGGVPIFTTPHTLRHSFATDLLMQGVDLREVQEFLGHKNIATTQIYAHVTSKKLRELHKKHHSLNE